MKGILPVLITALFFWILGGQWLIHKNCPCGTVSSKLNPLSISDGSAFSTSATTNLLFEKSGYEAIKPIESSVQSSLEATATYLLAHPQRELNITGLYMASETNSSLFKNLGLGRANYIETLLKDLKVPGAQIITEGKLVDSLVMDSTRIVGAAEYFFSDQPKVDDARLITIEKDFKAHPFILYFGTNKDSLALTESQRQKFSDLQYYLEQKANAKMSIDGHTDSKGGHDFNVKLSKERADFVLRQLQHGGIAISNVNTNGFGPDKPIASNKDEGGRSKNRRVVFSLQ